MVGSFDGSITLFYLKFFLTALWFFTAAILVIIFSLFRWRNASNSNVYSFMFTRVAAKILGYKVKIHNEERILANQPCVYLGNHQDTADLALIGYAFPTKTSIIGKREVLWIPFFGLLFYVCGNVLLQRKRHDQAIAKMKEAEDFITKKGVSILVFPEGTRNKGAPRLLPFKKGAFYLAIATQVPIVPIVAGPNKRVVDIRTKKLHGGTAHIEVLDPIPTKGLNEVDVDRLIEIAQNRMQEAFEKLSSIPLEN